MSAICILIQCITTYADTQFNITWTPNISHDAQTSIMIN